MKVATRTPLELAGNLSARLGNRILLKREDLYPVFSFKLRGAYKRIASLSQQALGSYVARPVSSAYRIATAPETVALTC